MDIQNNIVYKIKATLLMLLAVCITACNDSVNTIEQDNDTSPVIPGMVPLYVELPDAYATVVSRAPSDNDFLKNEDIKNIPDGNTLRLIVLNSIPTNEYITPDILAHEYSYVVRTANGKPYLYRCEVDDMGNLIPGSVENTPYYLEAGQTFYCMAISPARKMTLHDGKYMIAMKNGEELLATNNHWNQTIYSKVVVPSIVTERATVKLNPLMHTMARIRVTVTNGTNITELDGSYPAIEIDRIPTNPGDTWTEDNFNNGDVITMPEYNYAVGDTITAQMGNNILHNRMYLYDCDEEVSWTNIGDDDNPIWHKNISLSAETTILPMDARPTPVIIRLMLNVNLTPMQFHFQTRKAFLPGRTYNYIATVNVSEDAVYIVSWQDASWTTEVDPE